MKSFDMSIERNVDGTISRKIETCNGKSHQWDFEYDEAGRLTRALLDHGTAFWCEYDREGRRDRDVVTFRKDKARSYAYGLDNRLQAAGNTRFEHDQAGFRCGRIQPDGQTWRYHYNPDYQLLGATLPDGRVLSYAHDEEGRRIGKYVNGQLAEAYDWENFLQLAGFADPLGVAEFRYEPKQRMPCAMVRGGTEYALYYDQIGSLRAVADPLGNVVKEVLYSPFGAVIEDTNPSFSIPFGFAGGLFDRDLGFVRFGWRDYDTDTARWTAKDPIGAAGGDPDWYGYCLDDPINGNDPSGLLGLGGIGVRDFMNVASYFDGISWGGKGRGVLDGPKYGNWGGKNHSGGVGGGKIGNAKPVDSSDESYRRHDLNYERIKNTPILGDVDKVQGEMVKQADEQLANELKALDNDPSKWKHPPRKQDENSAKLFRKGALLWFD